MSADKCPSIFSRQMKAIVYIFLKLKLASENRKKAENPTEYNYVYAPNRIVRPRRKRREN